MKRLVVLLAFLLYGSLLIAQGNYTKENIKILPESNLVIEGSTNVNTFNCVFDIDLISDWKKVNYISNDNLLNFLNLSLHLETEGFDCGNKRMNSDFQDLLMCEQYPEIEIQINQVEFFSEEYSKAFISVKLAGKVNHYDLPVQINKDRFKGKFTLNIRDFGLEPPQKALGLIQVDEKIEIRFDLKITR